MTDVAQNILTIKRELPEHVQLVAVSKFHPEEAILEAYSVGQRVFGESRVQELVKKQERLPKDIEWHFIGHLQSNKVKYIAPFVNLIHSIDSLDLLREVNEQAQRHNRIIPVLLQIHIAKEETKFGFSYDECRELLTQENLKNLRNICLSGLMGMATFTDDTTTIKNEFAGLHRFFQEISTSFFISSDRFNILSMGMSDDYSIAIQEGSTMIRIGSTIFGSRN